LGYIWHAQFLTCTPIQRVSRSVTSVMKLPGCEADFLPTSRIEVKNAWSSHLHFAINLNGVVFNQVEVQFYIFFLLQWKNVFDYVCCDLVLLWLMLSRNYIMYENYKTYVLYRAEHGRVKPWRVFSLGCCAA
jgi:hypothetical protein